MIIFRTDKMPATVFWMHARHEGHDAYVIYIDHSERMSQIIELLAFRLLGALYPMSHLSQISNLTCIPIKYVTIKTCFWEQSCCAGMDRNCLSCEVLAWWNLKWHWNGLTSAKQKVSHLLAAGCVTIMGFREKLQKSFATLLLICYKMICLFSAQNKI